MIQGSSARETGSAARRVKEGRWEGHGAALCPLLSPRCHSGRAPQGPVPSASRAGCCWHIPAPRGPNTSFGGACGCAGGQDGDRVSPTSPVPMMAHARPRQLLGQGMVSLPIKPLLSPGPVRGGETPVAGWWIPQALPSPAFCIPTAPFPLRTAVPGHNGPFLPRHRRRLRSLGPFPGAEPPRWQPRRKNSSQ